jgi:hypothetical protein
MAGDPVDKGRMLWIGKAAVPLTFVHTAGAVAGRFMPLIKDMAAMFRWFETGRYVADPRRQEQLFGPVPTAENAIARFTAELGVPRRP